MSRPVLVVIGDVLHEPWHSISVDGQMKTWLHRIDMHPRIHVRHSHSRRLGPIGRRLDRVHEWARWWELTRRIIPRVDNVVGAPFLDKRARVSIGQWSGSDQVSWAQAMPDLYALQRWKIITSLSQALTEPEWNMVYFTTASSYVRVGRLLERIDELPSSGVYAGTLMVEGITGERFASGANRVLSRDVVESIVADRRRFTNEVMEDVGLGRLLAEHGIQVTPWPSMNLESLNELDGVADSELLDHHHFRLRSEVSGRRDDVALMHALHSRITALEPA